MRASAWPWSAFIGAVALLTAFSVRGESDAFSSAGKADITIHFVQPLHFGRVSSGRGSGSLQLNADSGMAMPSGLVRLSGREAVGRFLLTGEPNATFRIDLPASVNFDGPDAGIVARDLQVFPGEIGRFDATGYAELTLGGVLNLPPDTRAGQYHAEFQAIVEYQ